MPLMLFPSSPVDSSMAWQCVVAQEQLTGLQILIQERIEGLFQQSDTKYRVVLRPRFDGVFEISREGHGFSLLPLFVAR
jgi:hypothetical protein